MLEYSDPCHIDLILSRQKSLNWLFFKTFPCFRFNVSSKHTWWENLLWYGNKLHCSLILGQINRLVKWKIMGEERMLEETCTVVIDDDDDDLGAEWAEVVEVLTEEWDGLETMHVEDAIAQIEIASGAANQLAGQLLLPAIRLLLLTSASCGRQKVRHSHVCPIAASYHISLCSALKQTK
mgnify:CR=1 FL=1